MEKLMCPSSPLWSQVGHAAALGVAFVVLGLIAVGLDLVAHRAGQIGADRQTVLLLKLTARCLLGLDMIVILSVALVHVFTLASCLVRLAVA